MRVIQQPKARRTAGRSNGPNDGIPSSELVYRRLKDQIISGDLAPGSRLIELSRQTDGAARQPGAGLALAAKSLATRRA